MGLFSSTSKPSSSGEEIETLDFTDTTEIPGFSFRYVKGSSLINHSECFICFYDYHRGTILHMLPCNHIIHRPCLAEWYVNHRSCPLCRKEW